MRIAESTAIIACAVLFLFGASLSAYADIIDDLRKDVETKNGEIRRLEEEAAKFRKEVSATQERQKTLKAELTRIEALLKGLRNDIAVTQKKIERTSTEISAFSIEIAQKEESISTLRSGIAGLIESLRERTVETPLFVFVKYWRLSEFFSQLDSIEVANARIFGFLTELKSLKQELEIKKAAAEGKKAELVGLRSDFDAQKKAQEGVKSDRSNLLSATRDEEKRYQNLVNDREARTKALEEEVFAIEEKIRVTIDPSSLPAKKPGLFGGPLPDTSLTSCWKAGVAAKNCVTQYFGNTEFALSGAYRGKGHNGMDFRASMGTPVLAVASGIVEATGDTDPACKGVSYGKWVMIRHPNNLTTTYGHLSSIVASPGQGVARGDRIAYSGSSGYATGPHLHLSVIASQGVTVQNYKSRVCGTYMTFPIAALNAYINPLDYL